MLGSKNSPRRLGYKIPEVAAALGVSRSLIYRLVKEGQLPAVALTDNLLIIRDRDLDRFLTRRRA